jgi:phenylpropionate dioxygenase-like ring-hydroxylating dioxygenase large terminal subunit
MSLQNAWYAVCESSALKRSPLAITLFGKGLVLWRDESGQAQAFADHCPHRSAPLSAGKVNGGCLVCPYHGWEFHADGSCAKIPSLSAHSEIPAVARAKTFPVLEQQGYVWIWPGSNDPQGQPFQFPHVDEPGWMTFRMSTKFESSVEACLENFLDCPHTATVHRGWFRTPDTREVKAVVHRHASGVDVRFEDEPTTDSLVSRLLYPKGLSLKHTDRFIMPNLSRVDYEFGPRHHYIITSQATPITDTVTRVFTVITFRHGRITPLMRLMFEPMSRRIIQQDVDILKKHGDNVRRLGSERQLHIETDLVGPHMQLLRRRIERGESTPVEESTKSVLIRF